MWPEGILPLVSVVSYVVPEIGEPHDPYANEDREGSTGPTHSLITQ